MKAVRALGNLLPRYTPAADSEFDTAYVYQTMKDLAALPQPPILGGTLVLALDHLTPQMRRALQARPATAGALPTP